MAQPPDGFLAITKISTTTCIKKPGKPWGSSKKKKKRVKPESGMGNLECGRRNEEGGKEKRLKANSAQGSKRRKAQSSRLKAEREKT